MLQEEVYVLCCLFILQTQPISSCSALCWASSWIFFFFNHSYSYHYKVFKKFSETSLIMCAHIKYSKRLNPGRLMCSSGFWLFFSAIFLTTGLDSESQVNNQCWCLHLPGNSIWFAKKTSLNGCPSFSFLRVIKELRKFVWLWKNSEKPSDHWTFSNNSSFETYMETYIRII